MVQVRSIDKDGSKWGSKEPSPLHQCKNMETLAKVKPKDEEKTKKTAQRGEADSSFRSRVMAVTVKGVITSRVTTLLEL